MTQTADTTRRGFLSHAAPVAAAACLPGIASPQVGPAAPLRERETPLASLGRRAMACRFEVYVPAGEGELLAGAADALDEVDRLERQMTVYRDDSEVSRINRRAAERAVRVEPGLFTLFQLCERLTRETGGAFDVAAGALVKLWGFLKGPKRVPSESEISVALGRSGMDRVALYPQAGTIRFDRPGVELNLGSVGKGWALDRAAEMLVRRTGANRYLLHAGHSSVLARGASDDSAAGWWVGLTDPADPRRRIGRLRLRDAALSVSASTFRGFEHDGRRYGHTLDPRTGRPAEGVRMSIVVAPTAAEADALSTAFFVGGVQLAREHCRARPAVRAILLPDWAPTDNRPAESPPPPAQRNPSAGSPEPAPVILGIKEDDLEWTPPDESPRAALDAGTHWEPEV